MRKTDSPNHSRSQSRGRTSSRRRILPAKPRPSQPIAETLPKATGVPHGILEMHPNGYGFLRDPHRDYARRPTDAYVPAGFIRQFDLREGVELQGNARPTTEKQGPRLAEISSICGRTPTEYQDVRRFEEQTAVSPHRLLRLETGPIPLSTRVVDHATIGGNGGVVGKAG